jgi:DNA-binding transcriptional MocR family regulator
VDLFHSRKSGAENSEDQRFDALYREHYGRLLAYALRRRLKLLAALAEHGIAAHGRSGLNVVLPVTEEATLVAALLQRGWAITALGALAP